MLQWENWEETGEGRGEGAGLWVLRSARAAAQVLRWQRGNSAGKRRGERRDRRSCSAMRDLWIDVGLQSDSSCPGKSCRQMVFTRNAELAKS